MPRNFDELRKAKDLDFVIGGNTFSIHLMPLKMIGEWTEREGKVATDDTGAFTQMCIDRVADAVEDGNGASDRWRELCASDKGPSYGELLELARWAWEAQSDLPTTDSAASPSGRGKTADSSKVA
jgi:hypothetical protein